MVFKLYSAWYYIDFPGFIIEITLNIGFLVIYNLGLQAAHKTLNKNMNYCDRIISMNSLKI
jgi:hypothetical protein